jgi:hypothetical protein
VEHLLTIPGAPRKSIHQRLGFQPNPIKFSRDFC